MNEKRNYAIPETEVIVIKVEDVICDSGGSGEGGGNENPEQGQGF